MQIKSPFAKDQKEFIRYQHTFQSKKLLGEGFEYVHKEMDKEKGRKHRKYGHTRDFIQERFKGKEILAAYVHLLGDVTLEKICVMLDCVLRDIVRGDIEPPFYSEKSGNKNWLWDIDEKMVDDMMKKWGDLFIAVLKEGKL